MVRHAWFEHFDARQHTQMLCNLSVLSITVDVIVLCLHKRHYECDGLHKDLQDVRDRASTTAMHIGRSMCQIAVQQPRYAGMNANVLLKMYPVP